MLVTTRERIALLVWVKSILGDIYFACRIIYIFLGVVLVVLMDGFSGNFFVSAVSNTCLLP